jgi:hypothetical protein
VIEQELRAQIRKEVELEASKVLPDTSKRYDTVREAAIHPKCPRYNGTTSYEQWWERLSNFFEMLNLSEADKLRIVYDSMDDAAADFVGNLRKRDIRTLEDLDQILRPVFGDQVCYSVKFFRCHQKPDETFRAFSIRLATLAQRCGLQGKDLDAHMIDAFKNRTAPEKRNIMASLLPNTKPELAIQHGIWFEQNKLFLPSSKQQPQSSGQPTRMP